MLLLSSRIDKNTLQGRIFRPMAKYSVTRIESLENILKSTISSRHLLIFLILKKTYIHNSIKLEGIRDGKIQISTSSKSRESREFQDSKISEKNSFSKS